MTTRTISPGPHHLIVGCRLALDRTLVAHSATARASAEADVAARDAVEVARYYYYRRRSRRRHGLNGPPPAKFLAGTTARAERASLAATASALETYDAAAATAAHAATVARAVAASYRDAGGIARSPSTCQSLLAVLARSRRCASLAAHKAAAAHRLEQAARHAVVTASAPAVAAATTTQD